MATVSVQPVPREERFLLPQMSWEFYQRFLQELRDRPLRLTYDRGDLEIMAPSYRHERFAAVLGKLIGIVAEELEIPISSGRCTTFGRADLERGLEPDDCFYVKNLPLVLGKDELDLQIDPPPDLAIEIDISRSSVNRMDIYAALRVPEVWRFDGATLHAYCLDAHGEYETCEASPTFPFLPLAELTRFLHESISLDDVALARSFRKWVRKEVLPRHHP